MSGKQKKRLNGFLRRYVDAWIYLKGFSGPAPVQVTKEYENARRRLYDEIDRLIGSAIVTRRND